MPFDEYFWVLKGYFPGDPDFTYERYPELPYQYVLLAIQKGAKAYQNRLHEAERPIALNSALLAAQNRDPKKGKAPTYTDFCFYKPNDIGDRPDYIYGSAYMELVKQKRLPSWGLSFFKQLADCANAEYVPMDVALIAEDAILLHPRKTGHNSYSGMLLALESASERVRAFSDDQGQIILLTCPHVDTKIVAVEDAVLSP